MATIEYSVSGQKITTTATTDPLVKGTIGEYDVAFTFDSAWDTFEEKWAVFDPDNGDPWKQPIVDDSCEFPGEVMWANSVIIGVYGVTDGIEYPTIWASRLWFKDGANVPADVSDYPEPSPVLAKLVSTDPQTFTEEQKAQARENIDALGKIEGTEGDVIIIGSNSNIIDGGFKATEAFPVGSASDKTASFSDGANGVPIKEMTVQIEPIQAGSGDPSPSNVRAITGWTKAKVIRTGKNLCGGEVLKDGIVSSIPNATVDTTAGTVAFAGSTSSNNTSFTPDVRYKPNTAYTFIITFASSNNSGYSNIRIFYTDGTYLAVPNSGSSNKTTVFAQTSASKTVSMIRKVNVSGTTTVYFNESGVFEGVLTADDFVPYNGNTYEIEFPSEAGTVYGGQLAVNEDGSGTLTVDKEMITISQITWSRVYLSGHYVFRSNSLYGTASQQGWCECYNVVTGISASNVPDDCILLRSNTWDSNNRIAIRDDTYEDATAFKNAMGSYKIVREAKNPATYQLTAPQVSTLLGLNTIWSDTGDIAVEYHADPTLYVEEKTTAIKKTIAYLQDDFTAIQPYVVNDLVYVGDTLYIVTSAIAQGATMTPNTNCAETTLNAVIKSLR